MSTKKSNDPFRDLVGGMLNDDKEETAQGAVRMASRCLPHLTNEDLIEHYGLVVAQLMMRGLA